jgi:dipeptidyl aminopeptidase/acylaminoacyl peptidase
MRRAFVLALSILLSAALPATESDVLAFASLPALQGPAISPDGNRYAGLMSFNGEQFFVIVPFRKSDAERARKVALGAENELVDWRWVNDDWLLITVNATVKVQGEDWRVSRAFGVNARDAKFVPIGKDLSGQNGADILWTATDGTPRALIAMQQSIFSDDENFYPEVFEVDVSTGRRSSRARPHSGVMHWYADGQGNVRIGIGYHDSQRRALLLYRDKNGETFRLIDRANLRAEESLTVPALFLSEPGKALAYSDKSGFDALYELDLGTLTLGKQVFSAPGYDIGSLRPDQTGAELLGVNFTDTQSHTRWFDPVMSKTQRDLDKSLGPDRRAYVLSESRDQRRLMVYGASPSDPGAYYVADLDKRSLELVLETQPALRGVKLGKVSSFRYKARDGLEIEAVLTLPPERAAKSLPLIMMPHGGPAARDTESWDWWAQYLAHLGYAVVQPNYRGSTGYGSEFQAGSSGQWGLAMQDDLLDAIDHLAGLGTINPKQVCIVGGSYGGYAALRAAQRDGARYRCAVSFAGVADLNGILVYDSQFLNSGSTRDYWKAAAPDLKALSPVNSPEQFTIPVLLMHGKADLQVPVKQSRLMAERLQKAGKPVRYVEQPKGDHHLSRQEDRVQFLEEMTAFLRQHNPP